MKISATSSPLPRASRAFSFEDMARHQQEAANVIGSDPSVTAYMSTASGGNTGRIFFRLRPRKERPGAEEIIQELRPKLAKVPGVNTFLQILPTIRIGGQLTKTQYQYTLKSPN